MKNSPVLVVDPGDSTGWLLASGSHVISINTWEAEKFMNWLAEAVIDGFLPFETIVCEEYIRRPSNIGFVREMAPRICGALWLIAKARGIPIIMQQPSDIKTMVTPAMIRARGWTWASPHELDALKHLHMFLSTQ